MTEVPSQRVLLLLGALLCLGGCGKPSESQKPGGPDPKPRRIIAVSVLTMTSPFFKTIADAMTEEAARHGYEVAVVGGENDVARQRDQVKDFIAGKVSAIVLMPCDSKAIGTAIEEANRAGIPVFTADIACLAPGAKVVAHIATDNRAGGRQAAEALVEAVGGKGKVAILNHPSVESSILRSKGFRERLDALKAAGQANLDVVADLPGLGDRDLGFKCTQDLLQAHPEVAGIFAVNDPSALGALAALENAGKLGQVKVVGFDGQPEARKAIRDGKLYATLIQFPDRIGRQTVQTVVRHFEGETPDPQTLIPTEVYRRADAQNDPSIP